MLMGDCSERHWPGLQSLSVEIYRRCDPTDSERLCVLNCPVPSPNTAGVKQNYARRCRIPIDAITFDYSCMPADAHPEQAPAEGGAYVDGMFVEGARWDHQAGQLAESQPKASRRSKQAKLAGWGKRLTFCRTHTTPVGVAEALR